MKRPNDFLTYAAVEDWMKDGRCTDPDENPDDWFPSSDKQVIKTPAIRHALALCQHCDVAEQCLDFALTHNGPAEQRLTGIWGGTTEGTRRRMKGPNAA